MDPRFVLKGIYSRKVLYDMKKYILPPSLVHLANAAMIVAGVFALLFFFIDSKVYMALFLILIVLVHVEKIVCRNHLIRKMLKTILTDTQREVTFDLKFYENTCSINWAEDEKQIDISYTRIVRIAESRNYLALITKRNMCIPILKNTQIGEKYIWLDFVLEKNKKIKLQDIK